MAIKEMTLVKAEFNAITKINYEVAESATEGYQVSLKGTTDESFFVVATNSGTGAKKITVKAPTKGSYAAASSDLELSLEAGATAVIRIESARYANNDGTVVLIPESTDVKAVAVY